MMTARIATIGFWIVVASMPAAGQERETTLFVRDVNGRLQPIELRTASSRTSGTESIEEETIRQRDVNGGLITTERMVIHRTLENGEARTVTETFSRNVAGQVASDNHVELVRRTRRITTTTIDGGSDTVEHIEERVPGSPSEPIRVVRRAIHTVRRLDDGRWGTNLEVFELDLNGRFVLAVREAGTSATRPSIEDR